MAAIRSFVADIQPNARQRANKSLRSVKPPLAVGMAYTSQKVNPAPTIVLRGKAVNRETGTGIAE
jgi:hypothetical protein